MEDTEASARSIRQLSSEFHPLPGVWAQEQMNGKMKSGSSSYARLLPVPTTEIQRLSSSRECSMRSWGRAGKELSLEKRYTEDPRAWQNTLLPDSEIGTEGRGYG